jgi:exopolysaccharide production protein ExoQ
MKELIFSSPLNLLLILICGLVYIFIIFQLVGKSKKFGATLEKIIIGLYLFMMPGVGIAPFTTFHPNALAHHEKTFASAFVQISVYLVVLFIITPQLQRTLKDTIKVVAKILSNNPFFIIFLLLLCLSFSWSDTPIHTLKYAGVFMGSTIIATYIVKRYSFLELANLLKWVLAITAAMSAFYSMSKPGIGINVTKNSWQGIIDHPNKLAALMAFSAILWGLDAAENSKSRWLSIPLALFSLYVLQRAESGGARVLFLVGVLVMFSVRFLKQLPFKWAFFFIVIFMVLSISGFIVITENLETIVVDGLGKDMTLTGRTPLWEFLFEEKIPQRPVLGYGFHGFWQPWRGPDNPAANSISGELQMPSGDGFWKPPHAHNGFIEVILDLGYVGFFCFSLSFLKALADAVHHLVTPNKHQNSMIEAVFPLLLLIFVVFPNLTESPFFENNHVWYYYVFSLVGLSLKKNKIVSEEVYQFRENPSFPASP